MGIAVATAIASNAMNPMVATMPTVSRRWVRPRMPGTLSVVIHISSPSIRTLGAVTTKLSPGSQTVEDTRTKPRTDDGDHERFSHYVPKDKLTDAMVNGTPVIALCGKVWVPSRDPERYPVCPECKKIWENLKRGGDEE